MKLVVIGLATVLAVPATLIGQTPSAARVWMGTLRLPTYDEGKPDINAPFDKLGAAGRPNYPYTIRDLLTDVRRPREWRALFLENEFLKCSILPDLGGHLYGCTDKVNGKEMFYANSSIKPSNIAYRGSWAAFGIEFNFPVSHNWMTASPVDFALRQDDDGGASVFVGNTDRPYGMRWVVQLTLHPGRAVLEERATLTNTSDMRQRFYWWTNAGVRAFDDTQILYPMKYTASHGFTDVDTWPVDRRGTDNSVLKNHIYGPVSRFSHASHEGFMAIWQPRTNSGVAHYAPPDELPAKKIWSWGVDPDALDWRRALSDDSSAYVEIQAGLFRDQETYAWLEPHDRITFREYWLPVRELGGVTRVTPRAVLAMTRDATDRSQVRVAMNVAEFVQKGAMRITIGTAPPRVQRVDLTPATTFTWTTTAAPAAGPVAITITDSSGAVVMAHEEGRFDFTPDSAVRPGPQPAEPVPDRASADGAWLADGAAREVNGDLLGALGAYQNGLAAHAGSLVLAMAAGRAATRLGRWRDGDSLLAAYLRRTPADHEATYYRGVAQRELGHLREARLAFEFARQYGALAPAAERALAMLDAGEGQLGVAAARLLRVAAAHPNLRLDAAIAERGAGAGERQALELVTAVLHEDPASPAARYEATRLGVPDESLWAHLAGDPERVLAIASRYMDFGMYGEALAVLDRDYPDAGAVREAGIPDLNHHAVAAYYKWFVRQALGAPAAVAHDRAMALPVDYVFPHGTRTAAILAAALVERPMDQTARYLLAMQDMQRGDVALAAARWDTVARAGSTAAGLWRNLGAARLLLGDRAGAEQAYEEGTRREPGNAAVWVGLDSVLALRGAPPGERATALDRYGDRARMPTHLVYRYAEVLAAAGRFDDADALFADRWFSRVEGGTNPRGVWTDVRSQRAVARAREGRCREARAVVAALGRPVPHRGFTNDGMQAFLEREPVQSRRQEVERLCGAGAAHGRAPLGSG